MDPFTLKKEDLIEDTTVLPPIRLVSRGQTLLRRALSIRDDKRPREKGLVQVQYQTRSLTPSPSRGGICNEKFGPGKKRSGRTIFSRQNLVRGDQIWLPKSVRPNQKWSGVENSHNL